MVLTEEEALELLSYLVTAARTQLDEAAEYGPFRLLTAAQRLAAFVAPRASAPTREVLEGPIAEIPRTATRSQDPDGYAAALDQVCRGLGEHLAVHFGVEAGEGDGRVDGGEGDERLEAGEGGGRVETGEGDARD